MTGWRVVNGINDVGGISACLPSDLRREGLGPNRGLCAGAKPGSILRAAAHHQEKQTPNPEHGTWWHLARCFHATSELGGCFETTTQLGGSCQTTSELLGRFKLQLSLEAVFRLQLGLESVFKLRSKCFQTTSQLGGCFHSASQPEVCFWKYIWVWRVFLDFIWACKGDCERQIYNEWQTTWGFEQLCSIRADIF